jgi:hypothetical protein
MNRLRYHGSALVLAGLIVAIRFSGWAANAPALLSANAVMQKAVERAESPASHEARPNYLYLKHTVLEDMDAKGRIKERKEKVFEVSVEAGLSYLKLVKFNGQNLTPAELKKQDAKEAAERQKMMDAKPGKKGDERENFLTADLVQRFNYTLVGEKPFNGRDTYIVTFEPKPNLVSKGLVDRFINQMAGTAWIDAEDFEIARAEIHLKGEVTLWGGMVGTLKRCDFTMERLRLPDGIWFNSFSHGLFEGRKLLEPMLIRTRSESSDFRRSAGVISQ